MLRSHAQPQVGAPRPGTRFRQLYAAYAEHDLKWLKELMLFAALACFTIGVAFTLTSGPAWFFFALTFAIVATQSRTVATWCDEAELLLRDVTRKPQPLRAARSSEPLVTAPPARDIRDAELRPARAVERPIATVALEVSPPHPIDPSRMRTEPYGVLCDDDSQPVRVLTVPSRSRAVHRTSAP